MSKSSNKQKLECLQGWTLRMEAERKRKGIKNSPKKIIRKYEG